jgi:hypothetical protein
MVPITASQAISPEQEVSAKGPPVGVRLPDDIRAALEKLAKDDDRSVSYVIIKILREYLRARKLIK